MGELNKRILTSLVLISIIYLSLINSTLLIFFLSLISFFALVEFNYIFKKLFKNKDFLKFILIVLSLIYLIIFSVCIWIFLTPINNTKITSLLFILLVCVTTDIGGYVFGKLIGGKKLTKISPNKTYSGVLGSFVFSIIFGSLYVFYLKVSLNFEINYFIVIIVVSLTSQIGDLIISLFKRKAKIKDTGSILPGHGGILDRIDGILLALPIGLLLISI